MRLGCTMLFVGLIGIAGLAAGSIWVGLRMSQEPEVLVASGTAEDGVRGQQKIYEIASGSGRTRGRAREVTISEPELNAFLSRHLAEAAKTPFGSGTVRLVGDGFVEFKGQIPLRHVLAIADLLPARWLERPVWLHLGARTSLEVAAGRAHRRYLRLDVDRLAIGRQPLPGVLLRVMLNPAVLNQLRWRVPETVEAITIENRSVVIRTAS